jgi:hypothetical protein
MAGILMECEDCKFEDVYDGDEPCLNCYPEDSKWQPKDPHSCRLCKYVESDGGEEPCVSCYDENDKWQPKEESIIRDCDTCKYAEVSGFSEPCKNCDGSKWQPKEDVVNHPSHYETGKFECIDVMQEVFGKEAVQNFCMCNAFKYIYRTKRKNGLEDVKKAQWYINKYIELEEGEK